VRYRLDWPSRRRYDVVYAQKLTICHLVSFWDWAYTVSYRIAS